MQQRFMHKSVAILFIIEKITKEEKNPKFPRIEEWERSLGWKFLMTILPMEGKHEKQARRHFTLIRMDTIKQSENNKCLGGHGEEIGIVVHCWWEF